MRRTLYLLLLILPTVRLQTQLLKFRPNTESFTAEAGEDRRLECVYEGQLLYIWSLSWSGPAVGSSRTNVSGNGVTSSILTISDVHLSDAGTYICSCNSSEEVSARLHVIDDPEFLDVPLEQSLISGTNAVVQCQAYLGHPPATLLWFKDDSPIATTPGSRFSVDSDGLHIENVGMLDGGEYRCLLERQGWGAQFRDIVVEVLPRYPCIDKTKHPVVEVLYNEPLSINCTLLEGCALADVWWIKPDDTIVREQTLHQEAPHSPGIYSCFAHNQNGDDRYDVVLDIRAPPLPPASERDVLVNEGHTIVLSVDLSEITNPDPTYTWQSEGGASFPMEQEAQGGQRVYITEEGTLVIRYVTVEDSGTYHCTVQNEHGMSVQTVNLHVVAVTPPSLALLTQHIVKDCEDIEVTELTQQIMSELWTLCSCYVSVVDSSLECSSASEGIYTATIISQSEDAESLVELLDFRAPPLSPTNEREVLVIEGQTVMLSGNFSEMSNPDPNCTWLLEDGASFPREQGGQRVYITEEGALVIHDVTKEDSGTYHCTVQNEHVQTVNLHVVAITSPSLARLTLHIRKDCEVTEVTELTQQIVSKLWMLCSCYAIVIDDSLECSSASEGIYTAIVLSQSRDAESLVEELHGPLVEAILGEAATSNDTAGDPLVLPIAAAGGVGSLMLGIIITTIAIIVCLRFRMRTKAKLVSGSENDHVYDEIPYDITSLGENPTYADITTTPTRAQHFHTHTVDQPPELTSDDSLAPKLPITNGKNPEANHEQGQNEQAGAPPQDPTGSTPYNKYRESHEQCGDNEYEHLQTYEQAKDQYDQIQIYERRASVYEEVQQYEKPCDGYDHIQQYELITRSNPA